MAFLASVPGVAGWAALILPGGFLILVIVLALVSALSSPYRSDAAYRTLALIWTRQPQDEVTGTPDPDAEPPAVPPGRRPRRRR